MTPRELRDIIARLEISQTRTANLLGVDPRTMRRYVGGGAPIPPIVVNAVKVLETMGADKWTPASKGAEQ